MISRTLCVASVLAGALGSSVAKADTIENLVFTGMATCLSGFPHQECTPGSSGAVSGTYTLDVTSQQIIGAWSFTSPFGSFSSIDPGAFAKVYVGVMNGGVSYNIPEFSLETPTFNAVIDFGFTGATALSELGAISTPANIQVVVSGICQNVPDTSPAGCEPDVSIAGATALATVPVITPGGVVPIDSSSTTIEPGSWISIYGNNLAATTTLWNGNFPTALGDTAVSIDGKLAYIWYVSPTQVNVQAPDDTATGTVPVVLTTPYGSFSSTVTLGAYAPSFSLLNSKYVTAIVPTSGPGNSGNGYDIIGPVGAFSFSTRPVKAGETVVLYGVGFGPTNPPVPAGKLVSGAAPSPVFPSVTIGGVPATVKFSGIVEAGTFQLNIVVPALGSGDELLQATIGGMTTQSNVFIAVQ
jgi:uncharacterized protein (TIGR03437 family)